MKLPALIDAQTLHQNIENPALLLIDLRSADDYLQGHIEGAVNVPSERICCGIKPAPGKLPALHEIQALFESIGLTAESHVVTYDDAGGSWAGRMIWTLATIGHQQSSLLDGGIGAWKSAGLPLSSSTPKPQVSELSLSLDIKYIADMGEILQNLDNPTYAIWDARAPEEYNGTKVLGSRGGHIPGAINIEWTQLTDSNNDNRIRPLDEIRKELAAAGLTKEKTIVTHCQTHRRSGLTWFVANRLLGYDKIKAYPGSWSEWASHAETPIER